MKASKSVWLVIIVGLFQSFGYSDLISFKSSSIHSNTFLADYAFDGNHESRWASQINKGPEYLQIDFGQNMPVNYINIVWEAAYAKEYEVLVSNDQANWQVIAKVTDGKGGTIEHKNLGANGRFLRINCLQYGPHGLFSIWEVNFGDQEIKNAFGRLRQAITKKYQGFIREKYNINEIVFAVRKVGIDPHWYANFAYYAEDENRKPHKRGGQLCKINLTNGEVTVLVDAKSGAVRDPVVHYDAQKILFSYRKPDQEHFNLYEINTDGSNLKQITSGPYDDFEPEYLPDGKIVFVSSRCNRWVNCWLTQVATLYRCNGDGTNIHQLSANIEQDNTPSVLPDGRILYTRWEYIDRSQVHYHHLWTMRPDGTNQVVFFGNKNPGGVFIDARGIPGTTDVLMIESPGHGRSEHAGFISTVTSKYGPDYLSAIRQLNTTIHYRDPYPLSKEHLIAGLGRTIQLMDATGKPYEIFQLDWNKYQPEFSVHEPRPIIKRKRERVIPDLINPETSTGKLLLTNVYVGQQMKDVAYGSVKKLLVMETLPKPINYTGGMDPLTYGGSFTLEKILGTIPVEPDGSAYMELPANRSIFFIALDENNNAVKRMHSFTSVAPGETSSCVGCHESRTSTPVHTMVAAASKKPNKPKPLEGIPQVFDFPRDIQPILDKHCVSCHNPDNRKGKILLTGDHGPMFSHSYAYLTIYGQFVDGRNRPQSNYPPYAIGAYPSKLLRKVLSEHGGAKLSDKEIEYIRYWIESAATYPGTYASLGTGMIGGYQENAQVINSDHPWPVSCVAAEALSRRCSDCHKGNKRLPMKMSDESGISFWQPDLNSKAVTLSRHCVFNLSRPEKSIILLAPLAKAAGGYAEKDKENSHPVIFENTNDGDYQKILAMIQAGKEKLEEVKRFDMPGFKPRKAYVREMIKYGILPAGFDIENENVDVYKLDEQYWESLWYKPKRIDSKITQLLNIMHNIN